MNLLFTLYAHLYFVVYDERIHQRAASARIETEHQRFSHDSFERLWLIIAFISSTEPRVIVYNAQHCKNAIEFSSWWRAALNVLITLVCILNIKQYYLAIFFFGLWEAAFKIHLAQKYEGPRLKSRSGKSGISAGSPSGLVPPVRDQYTSALIRPWSYDATVSRLDARGATRCDSRIGIRLLNFQQQTDSPFYLWHSPSSLQRPLYHFKPYNLDTVAC